MKIIIGGRACGKTTKLIQLAAENDGAYIVCRSQSEASRIFNEAKKLDLIINFPITIEELKTRKGGLTQRDKLLFDDLDVLIRQFVVGHPKIMGASFSQSDVVVSVPRDRSTNINFKE